MKKTLTTLAVGTGTAAAVLAPVAAAHADDYGSPKSIAINIPGVINTDVVLNADVHVTLLNFVHLTLNIFPTLFGF